jgi:hypothetical protein
VGVERRKWARGREAQLSSNLLLRTAISPTTSW